jgi:hypothetical protein
MIASSIASAFPATSATTIMCFANRAGTENVSGNDWTRTWRVSKAARITICPASTCRATSRPW